MEVVATPMYNVGKLSLTRRVLHLFGYSCSYNKQVWKIFH